MLESHSLHAPLRTASWACSGTPQAGGTRQAFKPQNRIRTTIYVALGKHEPRYDVGGLSNLMSPHHTPHTCIAQNLQSTREVTSDGQTLFLFLEDSHHRLPRTEAPTNE